MTKIIPCYMAVPENGQEIGKLLYGCELKFKFGGGLDCRQRCGSCPVRKREVVARAFRDKPLLNQNNVFVASNLLSYYPGIERE